jgi:hypothetical protein
MRSRYTLLLAVLGLFVAAPVLAQPTPVIRTQLDSAAILLNGNGFRAYGEPHAGSLAQGANADIQVTLAAGSYFIVGVCDNDCTDLDLVLSDANGRPMASDLELDDVPMVQYDAPSGASFTVQVRMATCSVAPCAYGVQVFTRGS